MSTLKDYYNSTVAPAMMKKFNYENVMQIPKLDKVVVNVAAGEAKENAKVIDAIRSGSNHRSEAGRLPCKEVCRKLQTA